MYLEISQRSRNKYTPSGVPENCITNIFQFHLNDLQPSTRFGFSTWFWKSIKKKIRSSAQLSKLRFSNTWAIQTAGKGCFWLMRRFLLFPSLSQIACVLKIVKGLVLVNCSCQPNIPCYICETIYMAICTMSQIIYVWSVRPLHTDESYDQRHYGFKYSCRIC